MTDLQPVKNPFWEAVRWDLNASKSEILREIYKVAFKNKNTHRTEKAGVVKQAEKRTESE